MLLADSTRKMELLTKALKGVIDVYIAFLIHACCCGIIAENGSQIRNSSRNEEEEVPVAV